MPTLCKSTCTAVSLECMVQRDIALQTHSLSLRQLQTLHSHLARYAHITRDVSVDSTMSLGGCTGWELAAVPVEFNHKPCSFSPILKLTLGQSLCSLMQDLGHL